MHLGLIELPAVDDSGWPVCGEVKGVDKGGVAVVVDTHGAALVHAHQQRPERVVQQRRHSLALEVHSCHVLSQPRIAAHRPATQSSLDHCTVLDASVLMDDRD